MRKIIDGKRYDTDTAVCAAEWSNNCSRTDFDFCQKSLYRTPRGNWFVAGEGGANSQFAEAIDQNSRCGGSGLFPVTAEEAKELLESWDEIDALEEYFSDDIEDA